MKFNTLDFEGTKIRVGLDADHDIVLVVEDMHSLFGYKGMRGAHDMLNVVRKSGNVFQRYVSSTSREFVHVVDTIGAYKGAMDGRDAGDEPAVVTVFRRWLTRTVMPLEVGDYFEKLTSGVTFGGEDYFLSGPSDEYEYTAKWHDRSVGDAIDLINNLQRNRKTHIARHGLDSFNQGEKAARMYLKATQWARAEFYAAAGN